MVAVSIQRWENNMPKTYREKYGKEKDDRRKAEDKAWWDSLDRSQKNWAITRGIANVATGGSFGRKERLLERAGISLGGLFGGSKTKASKRRGGKDTDELDVTAKKGGGHVKKYTGGKSGDKYYGGGPVYPRPTKGN